MDAFAAFGFFAAYIVQSVLDQMKQKTNEIEDK